MPSVVLSGPVEERDSSRAHVLEPYGLERLPEYDYVQEEYFADGIADEELIVQALGGWPGSTPELRQLAAQLPLPGAGEPAPADTVKQ